MSPLQNQTRSQRADRFSHPIDYHKRTSSPDRRKSTGQPHRMDGQGRKENGKEQGTSRTKVSEQHSCSTANLEPGRDPSTSSPACSSQRAMPITSSCPRFTCNTTGKGLQSLPNRKSRVIRHCRTSAGRQRSLFHCQAGQRQRLHIVPKGRNHPDRPQQPDVPTGKAYQAPAPGSSEKDLQAW